MDYILLVEDSEADVLVLKYTLKSLKFLLKVEVINYGQEVLPFLYERKANLPKAILLDLILPDADGVNIIREIKSNPEFQNIPIAVQTGLLSPAIKQKCFDLGVELFMEKTVELPILEQQMRQFISICQTK